MMAKRTTDMAATHKVDFILKRIVAVSNEKWRLKDCPPVESC